MNMSRVITLVTSGMLALLLLVGAPLAAQAGEGKPETTNSMGQASGTIVGNDDKAVANRVELALEGIDELAVTSEMGVVTIMGNVKSEKSKQNAETKAKQVGGVTKVVNKLTVR